MTRLDGPIGRDRYAAILGQTVVTLDSIGIRAALPPLPVPLQTASGRLTHAPLLLVDLETSAGVTGVSYLFSPRQDMLKPLAETIRALAASARGMRCDPVAISEHFDRQFLLFGGTGMVTMARAAIDMAIWDAIAKQHGKPLFRLLGGGTDRIRAYESSGLGLSSAGQVAQEAARFAQAGFAEMKVRLGYASAEEDVQVLRAVRAAVGPDVGLMVDYNQALTREDAAARCRALEPFGLLWIEEPLNAADLEGAAALARAIETPVQIGENLFSPLEVNRALDLDSCDCLMPDVMKIGGVAQWLEAAQAAGRRGVPVSSHLFPEISAQLLACAPNRHFLEYVNWVDAILATPLAPENGYVRIPDTPGIGLEWDPDAVARYAIGI